MENVPVVTTSKIKHVNFLTFFWGYKYTETHLDILYRALSEYCDFDFDFHVLTDRPLDVEPGIRQWELWHDHETEGRCWRRLRAFHYDSMSFLKHYFAMDVDLVIFPGFPDLVRKVYRNDLTLCRSENPHHPRNPYSGTMWQVGNLKKADRLIWQGFTRLKSNIRYQPLRRMASQLRDKGFNGSDSAVLGFLLQGYIIPSMGAADGVYSYPHHIRDVGLLDAPPNAKVVLFHGEENEYLRPDMAMKYKFVDDYLKEFCKSNQKTVTIESLAEKHFGELALEADFLDSLREYSREIMNN